MNWRKLSSSNGESFRPAIDVPLVLSHLAQDIAEVQGRRDFTALSRILSLRALYGLSVPGKPERTASTPPERLHHGTSPTALDAIRHAGLQPMRRQYVHLSNNLADAIEVGRRKHREPVILLVRAADAAKAGLAFYAGNDKVWLADRVPWQFIAIDD